MRNYESKYPIILALSGWLFLVFYLYYNYIQDKPDFFQQFLFPDDYSQAVIHILIFTAPVISTIIGYVLNNRLVYKKEIVTLEERYKNLAAHDLRQIIDALILAFVNALDAKSPWTKGHSERVSKFSIAIAKEMGMEENKIETLRIASLLHDIGKIGTYDSVLDKQGKLTEEEFELVKKHPAKGVEILLPISKLSGILPIIRHHHERIDSKGYPDGLKGEEIPLLARMICVADSYDAMTAERPYNVTCSKGEAILILKECSGTQFDPGVVETFLRVLNSY
ncbi:MAG: HD-GYP domain-containing protein [Thermodesulfovibrionia bacterium]